MLPLLIVSRTQLWTETERAMSVTNRYADPQTLLGSHVPACPIVYATGDVSEETGAETDRSRRALKRASDGDSSSSKRNLPHVGEAAAPMKIARTGDGFSGHLAGDAEARVWGDDWILARGEADVQAAMVNISRLLNAVKEKTLTWDFEINGAATLGVFKPDGHGRLVPSITHRKNPLQHAVLVELKAVSDQSLLLSNDSRGAHLRGTCTDLS